jgi:hypothetical protein
MSDDIQRSLGRVEGKIDQLLDELGRHFADDTKQFQDIDNRLASVEKNVWYGSGVAAALTAIAGYFIKI